MHVVAMRGSYFRGDGEAVLALSDEGKFETVNFFVVGGQFAYVAEKGEAFETSSRQPDARLRLVYGNGTERKSPLMTEAIQAP